jgi:hypothetical protein
MMATKLPPKPNAVREFDLATKQQALPSKKYGVILADLRVLQ